MNFSTRKILQGKILNYLRIRDMRPLNPKMLWKIEPTIIAP